MKKSLLTIVFLVFLVSCSHVPAGMSSTISPKREETKVSGSSSYFSLFGIIPFGRPDYDAAIKNALGSSGGTGSLRNATAWFTTTYVFVGFMHTLNVEGEISR